MSPLYANRFAGHLTDGDPRTPLHGAAGCTFPTVPAFRYFFYSSNATGVWFPFRIFGALVIRPTDTVDHDFYAYAAVAWPPPWALEYCRKIKEPNGRGYRWQIAINAGSGACRTVWDIPYFEQKCNHTILLGDRECPEIPLAGSSGSNFRMYQVEYDEALPPNWD